MQSTTSAVNPHNIICTGMHHKTLSKRNSAAVPKSRSRAKSPASMLTDQDSNLERQNQNLQCYHYTIGQSKTCGCKNNGFFNSPIADGTFS
jgi:hypothetical protein